MYEAGDLKHQLCLKFAPEAVFVRCEGMQCRLQCLCCEQFHSHKAALVAAVFPAGGQEGGVPDGSILFPLASLLLSLYRGPGYSLQVTCTLNCRTRSNLYMDTWKPRPHMHFPEACRTCERLR